MPLSSTAMPTHTHHLSPLKPRICTNTHLPLSAHLPAAREAMPRESVALPAGAADLTPYCMSTNAATVVAISESSNFHSPHTLAVMTLDLELGQGMCVVICGTDSSCPDYH